MAGGISLYTIEIYLPSMSSFRDPSPSNQAFKNFVQEMNTKETGGSPTTPAVRSSLPVG